ncbi:FAD:protein FMN transferase [Marinagarivorans algicola]|uniref:FAD:protein FMN transferase n=1 Tax=Marinagarivorans algicola TaxID=1513270 RepID=UPI000AEA0890|nr:FAD:protein FMN transferase [Marinagarivorans algicola]
MPEFKKAKVLYFGFFFLVGVCFCARTQAQWLYDSQAIMGTKVSVSVWADNTEKGEAAIDGVLAIMRGVEQRLSPYIPSSELSILNANAAIRPVVLSDEMRLLYERSQRVFGISEGAFDITFASIGQHYDYREKVLPSDQQVTHLLPALSTRHLAFDPSKQTLQFLHPDVAIDLGGVAKGYAVDLAIDYLKKQGIKHAYVGAGGDSRVLGDRRGKPWIIGIKNPRLANAYSKNTSPPNDTNKSDTQSYNHKSNPKDQTPSFVIRLPLVDTAISTSGDYERFFIDGATGQRIHHILNPQTGRSATGVMSVTVLGDTGLGTDPLSTAVFVMGVKRGLKLINQLPNYDAIIIDSAGQVHYSNGLMPPAP